ncbi:MAG: N-carbamoyl-L-amino-acid hydrolase [Myxococcota bacterium]|jgi:N-carbamoyl-L-amino-acid hydrolase
MGRIHALGQVGALPGGGVCRLAFTEADAAGRAVVTGWMRDLGLTVRVDAIGNTIGVLPGVEDGPPVMTGSHIDTVRTGGLYDGNLGVLAGLEVIQTLVDAGIRTRRPLAVAFFTNEEGARFNPDMMGSQVFQGDLPLEQALDVVGIDGTSVRDELARTGGAGSAPVGAEHFPVHAFVELHVEQGPLLEEDGIDIGAVESVQGISWTEVTIKGVSNHAGTTPMRLRTDAGFAACSIATFVRKLAHELGGDQVATVGSMELRPNLVNVVANHARLTVDLRNTDSAVMAESERRLDAHLETLRREEGVAITTRSLVRFEPVTFDQGLVDRIEAVARRHGHSVKRMPSGAGHDAQILQRMCPAAMIFVPSVGGISHNIQELTHPADVAAGANILLHTLLELAEPMEAP